jgi:ABC-2 type transport system permease protein
MEDPSGPFDVGVYVKKTYGDKEAKLFLFTSINFFTDQADKMVANANLSIFTNCINEYIESAESAIVIPSKSYKLRH